MATVDEMLSAIAPEFDSVVDPRRSIIIEMATARTPDGIFPDADITNQAIALLAAFMLATPGGGSKGPVISKSVGPLRIAYGSLSSDNSLSVNGYGRQLMDLRRSYIMNPTTRNNPLPADTEDL